MRRADVCKEYQYLSTLKYSRWSLKSYIFFTNNILLGLRWLRANKISAGDSTSLTVCGREKEIWAYC